MPNKIIFRSEKQYSKALRHIKLNYLRILFVYLENPFYICISFQCRGDKNEER